MKNKHGLMRNRVVGAPGAETPEEPRLVVHEESGANEDKRRMEVINEACVMEMV